jgi:hypothetical protein
VTYGVPVGDGRRIHRRVCSSSTMSCSVARWRLLGPVRVERAVEVEQQARAYHSTLEFVGAGS